MTSKIEWDSAAASAEDAPVGPKLLNQVVPKYNELLDIVEKYNAATDVDEAVKSWTPAEGSEEAKLAKQIEQAEALIAKNKAIIAEAARKAVISSIDPDFDEAKVKAAYKDVRNELRTSVNAIRETFDMLGFVEYEISPAGRKTNYKGTNEHGELLVQLLDIPSIREGGKSGGTVDDAAKAERKAAKDWGRANGWEVKDKGQISSDLLNAYREAMANESK